MKAVLMLVMKKKASNGKRQKRSDVESSRSATMVTNLIADVGILICW